MAPRAACRALDADCILAVLRKLPGVREVCMAMAISREWRKVALSDPVLWTALNIEKNDAFTSADFCRLVDYARGHLISLSVPSSELEGSALRCLAPNAQLRIIELSSSRINGTHILEALPHHPQLAVVTFSGCNITAPELLRLKAALPASCVFDLGLCTTCKFVDNSEVTCSYFICDGCAEDTCFEHSGVPPCESCASALCDDGKHAWCSCDSCGARWCDACARAADGCAEFCESCGVFHCAQC